MQCINVHTVNQKLNHQHKRFEGSEHYRNRVITILVHAREQSYRYRRGLPNVDVKK